MMKPSSSPTRPSVRAWFALAGALALLYLFLLGTRGLNEPDEGRYANIALAMARPGGDWWEPRMSGYGHYDKPPLIYWVTALSFRAFGLHEWAARLPSLLGAVLALAGLGWTAFRLRGAWVAWWTVLICGTSAQFWIFGRILSPDMLLTGWCTLAVAAWAEGRTKAEGGKRKAEGESVKQKGSWGWWSLSLLFWTLAWWTKATPALVPLLGLSVGVLVTGDLAGRRALRPALLLPAAILLGSPWYVSMLYTYPELKDFFFGRELAGRLAGHADGRHGAWWYYGPISLAAWLPWWPLALWAAWQARARWPGSTGRAALAAWARRLGVEGWVVLSGLLILSLTSSKLASYTLTLAPWAALLMARGVAGLAGSLAKISRRALLLPAAIFAVVVSVGVVVLPHRWETRLGMNSSLREIAFFLRQQGASRVDSDRYWPGLEFYLGEDVIHYVIRIDGPPPSDDSNGPPPAVTAGKIERFHERDSDSGVPPNRFVRPELWPALPPDSTPAIGRPSGNWWFVRYRRKNRRRIDQAFEWSDPARRPVKVKRFGDFDVYRMPSALGTSADGDSSETLRSPF